MTDKGRALRHRRLVRALNRKWTMRAIRHARRIGVVIGEVYAWVSPRGAGAGVFDPDGLLQLTIESMRRESQRIWHDEDDIPF